MALVLCWLLLPADRFLKNQWGAQSTNLSFLSSFIWLHNRTRLYLFSPWRSSHWNFKVVLGILGSWLTAFINTVQFQTKPYQLKERHYEKPAILEISFITTTWCYFPSVILRTLVTITTGCSFYTKWAKFCSWLFRCKFRLSLWSAWNDTDANPE